MEACNTGLSVFRGALKRSWDEETEKQQFHRDGRFSTEFVYAARCRADSQYSVEVATSQKMHNQCADL